MGWPLPEDDQCTDPNRTDCHRQPPYAGVEGAKDDKENGDGAGLNNSGIIHQLCPLC